MCTTDFVSSRGRGKKKLYQPFREGSSHIKCEKKMRNIFSILIITVKINDFKWSHKTSLQCTLKYILNKFSKMLFVIFANTNKNGLNGAKLISSSTLVTQTLPLPTNNLFSHSISFMWYSKHCINMDKISSISLLKLFLFFIEK